jgi:soluble lytic murein transglycosylase
MAIAAPLIRAGFYNDAYQEIRRQVYSKGVDLKKGRAMLAALRLALGDHTTAHWMASKLLGAGGPTAQNVRTWATSFPLVFIQHIHKYAQTYDVHPMLVQAVMRQESGFRPKVKSYAGALGLMQLMPGTARYVARVFLDDENYRSKHIWKPETNIKLGSMYIRMHTAFASDRVPLALAGYNAGPAPLKRWFRDYGDRELDAWVESITYAQARGYVRKVMTSYITYSALYTPEAIPVLQLDMPKSLRRWGVIPGRSSHKVSARALDGPQAL